MTSHAADRPFDHVVITRFSAVFGVHPPPDDDWLFYRLGIFYDALHASLAAQTGDVTFQWLVFFDDRCSEDFRLEVERIAPGVFEPIWTHEVFWRIVGQVVDERADAPYVITTRIDSDDAVAVDFIAAIQEQFVPVEALAVTFPSGLQLTRDGSLYAYREPSGPFMSLIERRYPGRLPVTVWCSPLHGAMRAHFPLREVQAPPMWLQLIHGSNWANEVRGFPTRPERLKERFVLDLPYPEPLSRRGLFEARVQGARSRAWFWMRKPFFAAEWANTRWDHLLGTHTKPMRPGTSAPFIVDRSRVLRGAPRDAPYNDGSYSRFV